MTAVSERRGFGLTLAAAVLVGVMTAVQARINGSLGVQLDSGFVAAFISFSSGLLLLTVITIALPSGRTGVVRLFRGLANKTIPWWMVMGGIAGAFSVATQTLTVGIIGVSLFTVGIVAGQSLSGLLIDRIGYGPAGKVAVTIGRAAGGGLALAAVAVTLTGDLLARTPWWMLFLPFGAGIGIAWQQATNGRLGAKVGNPMTATLVNFIGGTAILSVVAIIAVTVNGPTKPWPTEPWLYLGGALGVTYIFMSAAIVHRIGVLLLGLSSVVGQLGASILIDSLWPAASPPAWWQSAIMVTLALAAVIVAAVPWHRFRRK